MRKVINKSNKGKVKPNKENLSSPRKSLNELDPRFDDLVRMMWRASPLRLKDLKAQLKKEKDDKKKQKSV